MVKKYITLVVVLLLVLSPGFQPVLSVQAASSPLVSTPYPVSVTAGYEHTCTLMNDGTVKCWGSNRYGQLGNSGLTLHPFAVAVEGLAGQVVAVDAGAYHTCAVISGGAVQCWGLNSSGQLGNGMTTNSSVPVTVSGLSGVTQIAPGYAYTCALVNGGASGTVQCWGDDSFGQLDYGAPTDVPVTTPVTVSGLNGVLAISASLDHTCALMNDRTTIYCWGKNSYGQLGTGSVSSNPPDSPIAVNLTLPPLTLITAIAAGAQHTCALISNGVVDCWGDGSLGQMGNNSSNQTQNPTPSQVYEPSSVMAISAGGNADSGHTCALTGANGVVCWGSNAFGQLGDGSNNNRNAPVDVAGLSSNVQAIAAGVDDTCALMSDHRIRCWGTDSVGQLGDGVVSISTNALDVSDLSSGVTLLGMGDRSTCVMVNGQAYCWGNNRDGQLGDGSTINRPAPSPVIGLSGTITAIDGGLDQTCAIVNGGVECWGNLNPMTDVIDPPTGISALSSGVTELSVTNLHGCAVVAGAARCWGDNSFGQLGDGTTNASYTDSVPVTGVDSGIVQVTTGQWFSCALKSNGTVLCWGDNNAGQLGNDPANYPTSKVALPVSGLANVTLITAGQDSACAILEGGSVKCWGNNGQGQLGNGGQISSFTPVQVTGLTGGVTSITAGGYHACALVSGGVQCWGFNSFGQLGNGLTTLSKVPSPVTGLSSGVIAVVAGGINYDEEQTCAITFSGKLKCWGGDEYGQLGDNLPIQRTSPVNVLGLAGVPEIGLNYEDGAPGSFFRVAATGFTAGANLSISIEGKSIGTIQASSEGYAIFHIQDNSNLLGTLQLTVSGASDATTNIILNQNSSLRVQEGSGPVYFINTILIYMPVVLK